MILDKEDQYLRLKVACKSAKHNNNDIARVLNLSPSAVSHSFRSLNFTPYNLAIIIEHLGINKDWLLSGKGKMFISESDAQDGVKPYTIEPKNSSSSGITNRKLEKRVIELEQELKSAIERERKITDKYLVLLEIINKKKMI